MEQFIENASNIQVLEDAYITDQEYKEFAYGLGLSPTFILKNTRNQDRIYLALREWTKRVRTLVDFCEVLITLGHKSVLNKLKLKNNSENNNTSQKMNSLNPTQKEFIAQEFGLEWSSICSRCNIETSIITNYLHGNATPIDGSRRFVEYLYNICYPFDTLLKVLRKNQHMLIARNIENMLQGITTNEEKRTTREVSERPRHEERVSNVSNPFIIQQKQETMASFVKEAGPYYTKICVVMNEKKSWKELARNYGVLNNPGAAKLVIDLSQAWEERRNNPTDIVFKLLIESIGNKPLDQFEQDLRRIDNSELIKVVDDWKAFRQNTISKIEDENTSIYVANVGLREFLLVNKISKTTNVDQHLARLTSPTIGVSEPDHLKMLKYDDFVSAGFSVIEARMMENAIKKI